MNHYSLGYAKPFGFGKMKVVHHQLQCEYGCEISEEKLYQAFLDKVCSRCHIDAEQWNAKVEPLFVLADDTKTQFKPIRYPRMAKEDGKEFEAIKNQKLSLADFSPLKK